MLVWPDWSHSTVHGLNRQPTTTSFGEHARTDLKAIDIQLAAAKAMVAKVKTAQQAASAIVRHENTSVLVALNQAADHEAAQRDLFNELTDGFVTELKVMLEKVGVKADQSNVDLVHALFVGLSVIDLATRRPRGEARAKAVMNAAFQTLHRSDI
jgi:hypothetical protein